VEGGGRWEVGTGGRWEMVGSTYFLIVISFLWMRGGVVMWRRSSNVEVKLPPSFVFE